jgi:hypothetical protein
MWDSKMLWHSSVRHFIDELQMDEVCKVYTLSVDYACIGIWMMKWYTF